MSTYSEEVDSLMKLSDIIVNNSKSNWEKSSIMMEMIRLGGNKIRCRDNDDNQAKDE